MGWQTTPALPRSLTQVELPDTWKTTTDGQRFLCIDDGQDDRILCFATDVNLRHLQQMTSLYMDGTFYSCPALWDQLYVIHGLIGTKMSQLVFCLLPNRRRETYNRLFDRLKAVVQEVTGHPLAPETIQTDFEVAAIRAVEDSFPNTDTRGCFFHYTQSIWKKVQHLEMVNQYRDNTEVNQWVRRAAALPLLPLHQVQDAWLEAMDHTPNIPQAIPFNDYMVTSWVDDDARFKPSVWNHSDNIGPRTNNHLEGWHSHLNKTVQRAHPNIFALIRVMQKLEKTERNKLAQFQHGARPPPRKRIYAELDQRLQRLKDQLSRRQKSPLEFLDAAGHIIKLG